ncbi:MAG: translesion DNA synthesis-associated protein ImuA [Candidimonas sp.]|nr:MAG: translesion DNA synthesis-associated protein ImuA [Candidimonas sp.]
MNHGKACAPARSPACPPSRSRAGLIRPESIHPALWRASSFHTPQQATVSTGFAQLDRELPGQGWPVGSLTELAYDQPGIGEVNLLRPAMNQLTERHIVLVHPPGEPCIHCCVNWQIDWRRLLLIAPRSADDALWAAEQILRHDSRAILLCWASLVPAAALRRLHLAARDGGSLFFLLRPASTLRQPSIAPLRLRLRPTAQGLALSIAKRQGPTCNTPVSIPLYPHSRGIDHVSLDLPGLPHPRSGRPHSRLAK